MRGFCKICAMGRKKGGPPGSIMFAGMRSRIRRNYFMRRELAGDYKTRVRKRTQNAIGELSVTL